MPQRRDRKRKSPVQTGYACPPRTVEREREFRALQKLIPPDTRDLTARFFGDPIPGDTRRNAPPPLPIAHEHRRNDGGLDQRFRTKYQ